MSLSQTEETKLFLAIDGGGTQCRARLQSASGHCLASAKAGPANSRLGLELVQSRLIALAEACLKEAQEKNPTPAPSHLGDLHVGAGFAGLHIQADLEALQIWEHPFASLTLANDAHIACLGAHGGQAGAEGNGILILGTGSCGYGLIDGRPVNVGGWGFPLSDGGCGARAGALALRHVVECLDGLAPAGPMANAIASDFDQSAEQLSVWASNAKPADYGRFAPLVVRYADQGDEAAKAILKQMGEEASRLLHGLEKRGIKSIALLGGFAPYVQPYLAAHLTPLLTPAQGTALDGALAMAVENASPNEQTTS